MSGLRDGLFAEGFFFQATIFLITADLAIALDIPLLRQIFGFFFLSIFPGILIIKILKIDKLEAIEIFVLSVGLSISFVLVGGLFINWIYLFLGYQTPLSTNCLLLSLNIIMLMLIFGASIINRGTIQQFKFTFNIIDKNLIIFAAFFPILGLVGVHLMNTSNNNQLLMGLFLSIAICIILVTIFRDKISKQGFPLILFFIGISLLFMWYMRSNYIIMGTDTDQEYYIFWITARNQYWSMFHLTNVNSCLSISLLPTIYYYLLNIEQQTLFRILYPLLFSILPIIIYLISKIRIGNYYAFIVSLFFLSSYKFFTTNVRVNLALIFFALAILVLFHDKINQSYKKLFFIIFSFSCIVSHYSTSYIFLIILLISVVAILTFRIAFYFYNILKKENLHLYIPIITWKTVTVFFVLLFLWYSQLTAVPFNSGIGFVYMTLNNLNNFFILESRSTDLAIALGLQSGRYSEIPQSIERASSWMIIFLIMIGLLDTVSFFIKNRLYLFKNKISIHLNPPLVHMEIEYIVFSILSAMILISSALPSVSKGYDIFRIFSQCLILLSPFLAIGAYKISRYVKFRAFLFLLIVLIPYFLSTTGFVYQIFNTPKSISLNAEGNQYDDLFIHDQERNSAFWLGEHVEREKANIYTDYFGRARVIINGLILPGNVRNRLSIDQEINEYDYIYLRYYNTVKGKIMSSNLKTCSVNEYQARFIEKNRIYSNGGSDVLV